MEPYWVLRSFKVLKIAIQEEFLFIALKTHLIELFTENIRQKFSTKPFGRNNTANQYVHWHSFVLKVIDSSSHLHLHNFMSS